MKWWIILLLIEIPLNLVGMLLNGGWYATGGRDLFGDVVHSKKMNIFLKILCFAVLTILFPIYCLVKYIIILLTIKIKGKSILDRSISVFIYIWRECRDWKTLILFGLVALVVGSPVLVPLVLGIIFRNAWLIGIASAVEAFWLMPLTPFIPLCLGITFAIKGVLNKYVFSKLPKRKNRKDKIKEDEK